MTQVLSGPQKVRPLPSEDLTSLSLTTPKKKCSKAYLSLHTSLTFMANTGQPASRANDQRLSHSLDEPLSQPFSSA